MPDGMNNWSFQTSLPLRWVRSWPNPATGRKHGVGRCGRRRFATVSRSCCVAPSQWPWTLGRPQVGHRDRVRCASPLAHVHCNAAWPVLPVSEGSEVDGRSSGHDVQCQSLLRSAGPPTVFDPSSHPTQHHLNLRHLPLFMRVAHCGEVRRAPREVWAVYSESCRYATGRLRQCQRPVPSR